MVPRRRRALGIRRRAELLAFGDLTSAVAARQVAARGCKLLSHLECHGWTVLHDPAVPGSRANLDHLAIGPGGVFVVDSKQYRGQLQLTRDGTLWHGRHPLTPTLRAVSFEADRAAQVLAVPGLPVAPIVAVHGAPVPWATLVVRGVTVVAASHLTDLLRARPSILGAERVAWLADRVRLRFDQRRSLFDRPQGRHRWRAWSAHAAMDS